MSLFERPLQLYQQRSFNQKFSDTTAFLRKQWRPLLIFLTYFLLPLCLLQAFVLPGVFEGNSLMGSNDLAGRYFGNMGIYFLCLLAGQTIVATVTYTLMRFQFFAPAELEGLTFKGFWEEMRRHIWRVLAYFLVVGGVCVVAFLVYLFVLAMLSNVSFALGLLCLLLFPALLILFAPAMLALPRIALTDEPFFACIKDGYRLGWKTLGGVLAVVIVMQIIVGFISGACSVPTMMLAFIRLMAEGRGDTELTSSVWLNFSEYLSALVYGFVNFCCLAATHVILAFQYGHAAETVDGVTAATLADTNF